MKVTGQVRLDAIGVRTVTQPTPGDYGGNNTTDYLIGIIRGEPAGVQAPDGYVVPTACDKPGGRVGEVVVTLTKTGSQGGALNGLRVTYSTNDRLHTFEIAFRFTL